MGVWEAAVVGDCGPQKCLAYVCLEECFPTTSASQHAEKRKAGIWVIQKHSKARGQRPNVVPAPEDSTLATHVEHGSLTHSAQVQLKHGP